MTAVACPRAWAARIASPTPPQAACRRSAAARAPRLSALPSSQNDSKTAPLNTDGAAAARRRTSAAAARPAGAAGAASADDRAAQKQLNKRICSARSAGEVLELVGDGGMLSFNLINAVTAFHRLAKHGMRLSLEEQPALAAHPATRQLATWLEAAAATSRLSDVQAAQLLWGHSQLGHGTARLIDAVYAQLSDAEVVCSTSRSGSSMNEPSSTGSSSSSKIGSRTERTSSTNSTSSIDSRRSSSSASKDSSSSGSVMQLESMGTAVTLVYAMARLHRPAPTFLASLTAALLAADDSGSSRRGWSSEQPAWQGQQQQQQGAGISLSCCDQRSLCLLLWSLATLGCCPRKLLLRGCAMLRHAGLAELSVRSMTQVLQAQDMAGSWDQQLVDDVAAELALRWHSSFDQQPNEGERHHEQHHYHHQKPSLRLNELDTGILARCLALAWRHAVAASVAGEEAFGNRLATGRVLSRHITASPHRCAAAQLLAASVHDLSPRLSPQGVSSLAHSFASMGGCPPDLLEALAERALELESKLDGQAVANLAWSYSSLRYDHPQLYSSLASAALRLLATPSGGHSAQLAGGGRGSFSAQAVSMLVFGFASANRCDSPEQQQLMLELAGRAAEVLEDFTPQGLSNLGWGLVVAACYPRQLLRRWRAMVGATAHHFKKAELNQLHLVEVALRLEAPGIGLHLPSQSASFFEGLYQTGRLRVFARHAWQRTLSTGPRSITDFQMQVHRTICELGVECELEHSPAGEYSVDIALPQHRVAVEVDGPVHFATNSRHLMGGTALKRRLLQRLGWHAVDVPFYDWWRLRPDQRQQYMRRKLQAAGLTLPEALAQEAQQHAADVAAAAPDSAADAATTDAQSTVLKLAPKPQLEAAAAEKPCSSSNEGALEAPAAASLAQRAQRLSMLQYRQGKLARGSMLARGKMQAAGAAAVASHEEMGATDEVQTAPPSDENTTEPGRAAARHTM